MSTLHDRAVRGFASDNYAGVHPGVLDAIAAANGGHQIAYGEDAYTARLHDVLAEHFPVGHLTGSEVTELADAMDARLDVALDVVPGLAVHADALRTTYARLRDVGRVEVQHIHGDLHLGRAGLRDDLTRLHGLEERGLTHALLLPGLGQRQHDQQQD